MAIGFLGLLVLLVPSRVWHYLFVSFLATYGLSYAWTRSLARGIQVARRYESSLVQVGDNLIEDFVLANRSVFPAPWLELRDWSDLPGYSVSVAFGVGAQAEERWRAGGICRQRGQFRLGPWRVTTGDPFGLFEAVGEAGVVADLLVYPPIGKAPEVALQRGRDSGGRSHMQHSLEQTITASRVREYVAGDPPRYIHWPTSLRTRALMVKDFDLEPSGDLWLVLDMQRWVQAGELDRSTEEYMVLAAAALAAKALDRNQAVGIIAYGGERLFVPPGKGDSQHWRIMRELATVRAQGEWPIVRVLETEKWNLGHGTSVVVLAPSAAADLPVGLETVRRLGAGVSVLLLDSSSFGGSGDVSAISRQLADMGMPYWVLDSEYEFLSLTRWERLRRYARRGNERWGLRGLSAEHQTQ